MSLGTAEGRCQGQGTETGSADEPSPGGVWLVVQEGEPERTPDIPIFLAEVPDLGTEGSPVLQAVLQIKPVNHAGNRP